LLTTETTEGTEKSEKQINAESMEKSILATTNTEKTLIECDDHLIGEVIGAAIEVHRFLGPGLLESVYEMALGFELTERGIDFVRQTDVSVNYRGADLGVGFRTDMIVENSLVLELKAVDVSSLHVAQLITYLKLLNIKRGLLLNFNTQLMKNGIKRVSI
jgi:GxxExxY protein